MSENIEQMQPELTAEETNELIKVRKEKLAALKEEGNNPYDIVKFDQKNFAADIIGNFDELEGKNVSVAGRLMSKRGMGKASFCDLADKTGKIQLYIRQDGVGEESYAHVKKFDIGDIVGVEGEVFRTHKGEISIKVLKIDLLSKSLRPLPEKWHGLKDTDLRYRQRYVDLIINPEVKDTFLKRSAIIREIRAFLDGKGFVEVETPVLNSIPGGAAARPFITHHNTLDIDMYLRIATELHLKRLIVGGMERVYEIGRIFRNEGISIKHNPEFTSIEIYQAYADYHDIMDLTEELVTTVANKVLGTLQIEYEGTPINLESPWARMTMIESIEKFAGIDFSKTSTDEEAAELAKSIGIVPDDNTSRGDIINLVFEEKVEENLIQPTFIMDYPVEVSPLAKRKKDDPSLTERFEVFVYGRELGNAFSELNDPIDQKERFMRQVELRENGDDEANMMDDDFVTALEYGMPPTGGLGIGIDRLVMFLTNSSSIRDVLLFPTMKPLDNK